MACAGIYGAEKDYFAKVSPRMYAKKDGPRFTTQPLMSVIGNTNYRNPYSKKHSAKLGL